MPRKRAPGQAAGCSQVRRRASARSLDNCPLDGKPLPAQSHILSFKIGRYMRLIDELQNRPFFDTLPPQLLHSLTRMLDLCQNLCQNLRVKTLALS
jgi:hypothetical protein